VSQVREVAAAGETMPPKSTFFFPKLLTGLVLPAELRRARGRDLAPRASASASRREYGRGLASTGIRAWQGRGRRLCRLQSQGR
jgi:hypothetical protein